MIPQPEQLRKIVDALGVSPMIFFDDSSIKLETRGDLMGLMIVLCKNKILLVKGKRDRNSALIPSTVTFEFSPLISKFFSKDIENIIKFNADDPLLLDFLKWEKQYHNYEKMFKKYSASSNASEISALNDLRDIIEKIEIELQCSSVLL